MSEPQPSHTLSNIELASAIANARDASIGAASNAGAPAELVRVTLDHYRALVAEQIRRALPPPPLPTIVTELAPQLAAAAMSAPLPSRMDPREMPTAAAEQTNPQDTNRLRAARALLWHARGVLDQTIIATGSPLGTRALINNDLTGAIDAISAFLGDNPISGAQP